MALVYLFLGAGESHRLSLIHFLIKQGLEESALRAVIFVGAADRAENPSAATALASTPGVSLLNLPVSDNALEAPPPVPDETRTVFIVTSGRDNPVDQLEFLHPWLRAQSLELARIFTVVDCRLAARSEAALTWFDACIHFSDVVLLGNRDESAKKWVADYQRALERRAMPAHVALLKADGRVEEPLELLYPEARRLSLFFDDLQHGEVDVAASVEIQMSRPTEEDLADEQETPVDPYLERDEAGARLRRVPDVRTLP